MWVARVPRRTKKQSDRRLDLLRPADDSDDAAGPGNAGLHRNVHHVGIELAQPRLAVHLLQHIDKAVFVAEGGQSYVRKRLCHSYLTGPGKCFNVFTVFLRMCSTNASRIWCPRLISPPPSFLTNSGNTTNSPPAMTIGTGRVSLSSPPPRAKCGLNRTADGCS